MPEKNFVCPYCGAALLKDTFGTHVYRNHYVCGSIVDYCFGESKPFPVRLCLFTENPITSQSQENFHMISPTIESARGSIIVALDKVPVLEALDLVQRLEGSVGAFKVNDLFFDPNFETLLNAFISTRSDWFLDLKLHDIPNTVKNQVARLADFPLAPKFLTVHASGGKKMMESAKQAAQEVWGDKTTILGVTVLTSLSPDDCKSIWGVDNKKLFQSLLFEIMSAKLNGLVCSVEELDLLSKSLGDDIFAVVPGIRPPWYEKKDDQERVTTPYDLFKNNFNARYMVIGRPIVQADDTVDAVHKIASDALRGILDRGDAQMEAMEESEDCCCDDFNSKKVMGHRCCREPYGDFPVHIKVESTKEPSIANMFLDLAFQEKALTFEETILKSGRVSPYFLNTGLFNRGDSICELTELYAKTIAQNFEEDSYVIAGPSYKGIPLAVMVASHLASIWPDQKIGWAFDRKEVKDHGEGGLFVGSPLKDRRVIIVDDVITTGATKLEFIDKLESVSAHIYGLIVAFDRKEKNAEGEDPLLPIVKRIPDHSFYALATLKEMMSWLQQSGADIAMRKISEYSQKYSL